MGHAVPGESQGMLGEEERAAVTLPKIIAVIQVKSNEAHHGSTSPETSFGLRLLFPAHLSCGDKEINSE